MSSIRKSTVNFFDDFSTPLTNELNGESILSSIQIFIDLILK
jgi:hypothetical protein